MKMDVDMKTKDNVSLGKMHDKRLAWGAATSPCRCVMRVSPVALLASKLS